MSASVEPIEGINGILGSAGPCLMDSNFRTRFGTMRFDSADVEDMILQGTFTDVVLHEVGSILLFFYVFV
jgi:hypothetical protein